jgi:hypothetical protein
MPTKRGAPRWALDNRRDFESTENRTRQYGDKSFAAYSQLSVSIGFVRLASVCLFNPARSNSCVFRLSKERGALTKYGEPGLRT